MRRLRRCCLATVLLLGLLLWLTTACAETLHGRVSWIHDGDTIKVTGIGTVRLLGIDAPESENSTRDRYFQRWNITPAALRRIHYQGKTCLIATLKGQIVTLETEAEPRDRHGRLLAYVFTPDGQLLNRWLLEQGYAVVYRRFDFTRKADFLEAETRARRSKAGLWK